MVECGSNSAVNKFSVRKSVRALKNFLCYLKLESFEDCLVIEEAGKLDICDKLLHVDERESHKFEHFLEKPIFGEHLDLCLCIGRLVLADSQLRQFLLETRNFSVVVWFIDWLRLLNLVFLLEELGGKPTLYLIQFFL
jgi:hypothetical protein